MIDPHLYAGFVLATTLLMLLPGPNVALTVANSVAYGARYGLITIAGTSSAMAIQLALTALGMATLLGTLGDWFEGLRWCGVAYLLWLGFRQLRAPPVDLSRTKPLPPRPRVIYLRGLLVSLTNPKVLFFYAAFFPQFVTLGPGFGRQMLLLAVTFVALAVAVDTGWALLAARARGVLAARGKLRNRLAGGLFIGAGLGLAWARRS